MYRHYEGSSGRSRRVGEPEKKPGQFQGKKLAPLPETLRKQHEAPKNPGQSAKKQGALPKKPAETTPPSPLSGLSGELGRLFGRLGKLSLDTEDLLLIAVLYLMYRESGDKELLIMIGALLFL